MPRWTRLAWCLPVALMLAACDRAPVPASPGLDEQNPGSPAPQARPRPSFDVSQVDATRLRIAGVSLVSGMDPGIFPRVTRFQDPRLKVRVASPDGKWLVWRGQDAQAYWLFLEAARGGPVRRLDACRNGYQAVWSPDSRRILYSAMDWRSGERSLYIYSLAAGRNVGTAFKARERLDALAAWSPDGGKIVFSYYGNLWVMNADGIGRTLLDLAHVIRRPVREAAGIAWSGDGTRLAYQMRGDPQVYLIRLAPR